MRPTEAVLGKATFTMPITRWLEDGFGLYWGGLYALFADAPLASAIWTTLPAGKVVTTSELNMSFVRPMSRKTASMVGRAETVHSGSQVGLSMIQITDQDGRLLAFGSTRCLVSDVRVDPHAKYPAPDLGPTDPPDPYLRPAPEDGYFNLEEVMSGIPIELQRRTVAGEKVFPVWRLTGYRPIVVEDGHVKAILPSVGVVLEWRPLDLRGTSGVGRRVHDGCGRVLHALRRRCVRDAGHAHSIHEAGARQLGGPHHHRVGESPWQASPGHAPATWITPRESAWPWPLRRPWWSKAECVS